MYKVYDEEQDPTELYHTEEDPIQETLKPLHPILKKLLGFSPDADDQEVRDYIDSTTEVCTVIECASPILDQE